MFEIIIRKGKKLIKRYKYKSYEEAMYALDEFEYRLSKEYTIEYKDKVYFA